MLKGTDLSAVQGVLEDKTWAKLASDGLRFAFLRTVVGNDSLDRTSTENARRARAHGLLVAPYVFPYPLPHLHPIQQAELFVRGLEETGMLPDELPPMFDAEWPPREEYKAVDGQRTLTFPWKRWGCSPPQIRGWLLRCLDRCEELTGMRWLVYSYRYWLKCIEAHLCPELAHRELVLADYTYAGRWPTDAELARLKAPAPWTRIAFVQHDGNGGMRLPTGADVDYDCFLGTEADLRALSRGTVSPDAETAPDLPESPPSSSRIVHPRVPLGRPSLDGD